MRARHPRWDDVKKLFLQAIDLPTAEREEFLDRTCGKDAELRSEVASLLAWHDNAEPFLDRAAVPGAAHAIAAAVEEVEQRAEFEPGRRIGQYEILESLGAGGMGIVYRAHDTRLDRFVALKIVHDRATGVADRVLREARAASALNHPNICTLYEVGEVDGHTFLAMEHIAGHTLSTLIPPDGLRPGDVITYGVKIADALAHAHERGVIHRDLKGANVLITPQGCAKVLDFGLARRDASVVTNTMSVTPAHPGTIAGTPAFMAPELLRGGKADARSDIWALGVLLYEMASGRRPYVGETPFEVTSAILRDTPPPLPSRVPAALRSVIVRCLARDPGDRFQHASDLSSALRTGQSAPPRAALAAARPGRRRAFITVAIAAALSALAYVGYRAYSASQAVETTSVAVMPFNMLSGPPELAFLEIGVPETIMSRLALVNGLRVRPVRTALKATENLKGLHVDYVLTGSILKWGDAIRITPQLVRVSDAAAIWTHAYTLPSTDLLAMQDEIARGVANALPVRMTAEDRARISRQLTQDAEAYALYVRGRAELVRNDRSDASTAAAVNSFQAAIGRDQNYVLAYAGLAMASAKMRLFFATEPEVAMWQTRARQAAQRAVQLNSDLAETHEALAAVYRSADFDWPATLEESARALKLNPSLDQPHAYRASAFSHLGLLDRVQAEANAARENNPANESEPLRVQGATAMYAGRFDDAVRLLEAARAASGSPTDWNLAYAYYYAGHRAESESMLQKMTGSARSHRRAQATLASFLAARGEVAKARELIGIVTSASYQEHHIAYALGAAYAQLGMPDEALQRLTDARATGFRCYPWFERDPLLAPLRQNAKFRAFLEDFRQWWETTKAAYETNG